MHESFICNELLDAVPDTVHAHFPLHHERHSELCQLWLLQPPPAVLLLSVYLVLAK